MVELINEFRSSPAYYAVDGLPFVSTFEGPGWAENWEAVRRLTGGIYLVPDWSSLGPEGVGRKLDVIDGAFSWAAWPRAGEARITTVEDELYRRALRGKAYMMGVSPWFYTSKYECVILGRCPLWLNAADRLLLTGLPQWDKNWHSSGESLWFDRWAQILDLKPDFVQIITCRCPNTYLDVTKKAIADVLGCVYQCIGNDFGESSYICDPARPSQVVPGASDYVDEYSHAAFRATLPYFIKAYKAGRDSLNFTAEEDCAIAWYRTTPAGCGPDGGTLLLAHQIT